METEPIQGFLSLVDLQSLLVFCPPLVFTLRVVNRQKDLDVMAIGCLIVDNAVCVVFIAKCVNIGVGLENDHSLKIASF